MKCCRITLGTRKIDGRPGPLALALSARAKTVGDVKGPGGRELEGRRSGRLGAVCP
jgi:hypothetical protein